jgi:hypothetical protein
MAVRYFTVLFLLAAVSGPEWTRRQIGEEEERKRAGKQAEMKKFRADYGKCDFPHNARENKLSDYAGRSCSSTSGRLVRALQGRMLLTPRQVRRPKFEIISVAVRPADGGQVVH